jgi:hypothetical protein
MTPEELVDVINLDHPAPIMHLTTGQHVVSYTLCYILLNFVKMSDGHHFIAEARQSDISMLTYLIILNTPKAEQLVGMMNKNLPAFLLKMLNEQGLLDDFIDNLLKNSCEGTMLAKMYQCMWDPDNRVLTTEEEVYCAEETKVFEGAAWFKDEFGLLSQNSQTQKRYTAPEALFKLDESGLRKTIHDHHEGFLNNNGPNSSAGTPHRAAHGKTNSAVGMANLTRNTRDSASQMSPSSSSSKDVSSSSDKGLRSRASNDNEDGTGLTGSR